MSSARCRAERWSGPALLLLLALPPVRAAMESALVSHALVQIPLLILAGAWLTAWLPRCWREILERANANGIPGLLLALETFGFWMIPRSLDGALAEAAMEWGKFLSLPLLAGIPLALSLPRLSALAKGFVAVNLVTMCAVAGWLYLASPARLCNNYLLFEQAALGKAMLLLAGGLLLALVLHLFLSPVKRSGSVGPQ